MYNVWEYININRYLREFELRVIKFIIESRGQEKAIVRRTLRVDSSTRRAPSTAITFQTLQTRRSDRINRPRSTITHNLVRGGYYPLLITIILYIACICRYFRRCAPNEFEIVRLKWGGKERKRERELGWHSRLTPDGSSCVTASAIDIVMRNIYSLLSTMRPSTIIRACKSTKCRSN